MSPGALSYFLIVFLASPPRLHISPSESWSRSFMRRTLPIMSMVITFYIPAESFSRAVEHPCQIWIGNFDLKLLIFGRRQQSECKMGVPPGPSSFKKERVKLQIYASRQEARSDVFNYMKNSNS